jgi:hypothetical protein
MYVVKDNSKKVFHTRTILGLSNNNPHLNFRFLFLPIHGLIDDKSSDMIRCFTVLNCIGKPSVTCHHHRCEDYRGTRFYNTLVIKRWVFNGVVENVSGLTFQEWTPKVDTSRSPVAMLIKTRNLCATGFNLNEVFPPVLETTTRVRTRGAGL